MKYIFADESWEDYLYWQKNNKKLVKRINDLLKDISRNPYSGIGKPELLKYKYKGFWSRRIDREHSLIYQIKGEEILIAKCRFHYDQNKNRGQYELHCSRQALFFTLPLNRFQCFSFTQA